MGCHTWFYRKLSTVEIENAKMKAIQMAYDLCGNTAENKEYNCVDLILQDKVISSVENGTVFWLDNGWGFEDQVIKYQGQYFIGVKDFHDVFRVIGYPQTVLKGFKNTLNFLRKKGKQYQKKYGMLKSDKLKIDVEINDVCISELKSFFKEYKGGIIKFG